MQLARDPLSLILLGQERPASALAALVLEPVEHLVERLGQRDDVRVADQLGPHIGSQRVLAAHRVGELVERRERRPQQRQVGDEQRHQAGGGSPARRDRHRQVGAKAGRAEDARIRGNTEKAEEKEGEGKCGVGGGARCSPERIGRAARRGHGDGHGRLPQRRDTENELYDLGCDLIEAAAGISRCAAGGDAARAVPALLGCIEAALEQLGSAAVRLQRTSSGSDPLDRGYANLVIALQDARRASHAARALAARHGS